VERSVESKEGLVYDSISGVRLPRFARNDRKSEQNNQALLAPELWGYNELLKFMNGYYGLRATPLRR
jgi:hypothetical protein